MELLIKCRKFEVVRKAVPMSGGVDRDYTIVVHPGAVVILPLLAGGEQIVLIRNYRHALDRELWELPAGTLDVPGETASAAAARELEEEAGYRAGDIRPLCEFYSTPGMCTELLHAFVATDLTPTRQQLDPTERIRVEIKQRDEALAMVRDGTIVDAKTMVTLLFWEMTQRKPA
ncbi:MAG: NUDIX hydrolase [Planctomycetota bacterium]